MKLIGTLACLFYFFTTTVQSTSTKLADTSNLETSLSSSEQSMYLAVATFLGGLLLLLSLAIYSADVYLTSRLDSYLLSALGPEEYHQYTSEFDNDQVLYQSSVPRRQESSTISRIFQMIKSASNSYSDG